LSATLLEIKDLTSGYGKLAIVQDVDLDVVRGSILALIGPNGSGKSTLVKSIVGAANVLRGRIHFQGKDITSLPSHEVIKLGIGYVPQTENVFSNLTVSDNLELGAYVVDDKQAVRDRMQEMFQLFPILRERRKQKARTLSGGERQILAISKALMTKPVFLILDEPTASVDPGMVSQIVKKICEVRDSGVTEVLVEQNVKKALQIADQTMVMTAGRKVFAGDTRELADHQELGEVFLGKKLY
jgi:branched-chain amino acid transport system ATP-binding protein